jgi:hypothetical protein
MTVLIFRRCAVYGDKGTRRYGLAWMHGLEVVIAISYVYAVFIIGLALF